MKQNHPAGARKPMDHLPKQVKTPPRSSEPTTHGGASLQRGTIAFEVLEAIHGLGPTVPVSGRELEALLTEVDRGSIGPVLSELHKNGWVERRWVRGNRRAFYQYRITAAGSAALATAPSERLGDWH